MSNISSPTYTQKKYLFAIYRLGQNGGEVRTTDVAKIVGVSKASTTAMTARLSESGFIEKSHYGRITLTERGLKEANSIFTSCLIIQDFLEKKLNIPTEQADADAVQIVRGTSELTASRFVDYILSNQ